MEFTISLHMMNYLYEQSGMTTSDEYGNDIIYNFSEREASELNEKSINENNKIIFSSNQTIGHINPDIVGFVTTNDSYLNTKIQIRIIDMFAWDDLGYIATLDSEKIDWNNNNIIEDNLKYDLNGDGKKSILKSPLCDWLNLNFKAGYIGESVPEKVIEDDTFFVKESDVESPVLESEVVQPEDIEENLKDPTEDPKNPADDPKDPEEDPKDPAEDPKDPEEDPKDPADDPKNPEEDSKDSTEDPKDPEEEDSKDSADDPKDPEEDPKDPTDNPGGSNNQLGQSSGTSSSGSHTSGSAASSNGGSTTAPSKKDGIVEENGKLYHYSNGELFKDKWVDVDGNWYYASKDGSLLTNREFHDSKFFNNYYRFDKDGKMMKGWYLAENGDHYYYDKSGARKTKWLKQNEDWYHFNNKGVMTRSKWITDKGKEYKLGDDGKMFASQWTNHNGSTVYVDHSGAKKISSWLKLENDWYYLNSAGKALTGWQQISNDWYYLYPSDGNGHKQGSMAHDTSIEGYTLNSDGAMVN